MCGRGGAVVRGKFLLEYIYNETHLPATPHDSAD